MANINNDATVLFLDFDGVLHPRGGTTAGERFSKKPMLEALLREPDLQHVVVVISSTWREVYPLSKLVNVFSGDIRPRVVDITPVLNYTPTDFLRYREIRAWLGLHQAVDRWVVLDDAVEDFPYSKRANGVFTNPAKGLDDSDICRLRSLLKEN